MTGDLSDDTRSLIRNALAAEAPPTHGHRSRLRRAVIARAAVGSGAALLLGTSVAKAGGKSLFLSALGSAGIGLGAGLVFVGAAHFAFERPAASKPSAALSAPAPAQKPLRAQPFVPRSADVAPEPAPKPASAVPAPAAPEQLAPAVLQPPVPSRSALADSRAAPAASAVPDSALRAELDLLAEAQGALRDGQGTRALELISRYDARFPRGALASERLAAEVFASCQVGDSARAQRVAAKFLALDSTSALAARVKNACARPSSP